MTLREFKPLPKGEPVDPMADWNIIKASDMSTPLPPIPWVCEPLGLAPGAVSLFAGYGYSRKTMALQSLGLSVAFGKPVWGVFSCRRGSFVHLDYEQGRRLTQERYQRLARGMGQELTDLSAERLRVAVMPRKYLTDVDEDTIARIVDDAAFVLVDSLRASFPGTDENNSDIRYHLDVLSRVSERTGAAIAVIHHARKPSQTSGGTATHAIRGSSALFDACQTVYVFEGEKDTPTRVHHQKDRVRGQTLEEFGLTSEDVGEQDNPRWGLRVRHLEREQMVEDETQKTRAKERAALDKMMERIAEYFAGNGGVLSMNVKAIRAAVGGRGQLFDAAWGQMTQLKFIYRDGTRDEGRWVYRPRM